MRRPATVTVTINDDSPTTFDLSSTDLPIKKVKHNGKDEHILEFDNNQGGVHEDGFEVSFEIDDRTKKGYGFFVDDPEDPGPHNAVSAKVVDGNGHCPPQGSKWATFTPTDVNKKRQTLVVTNKNDQLQYFGFALHFSLDGETSATLNCDPIGDNKNGHA